MLEFDGVSKRYRDTQALAPTRLGVPAGRTTVLIGPSGCGKSTLLRLVAGLVEPDAGEIRLEGTPLTPDTLAALRRRMGYVIQEGGLFPHLTAQRNVTLMARHLGWEGDRIQARVEALTEMVHLPRDALGRYPLALSGGQRQRVSLMRALMLDPDLLLLDEPLGALDPMIRYRLQGELKAIFDRLGKTVLMVTHDLAEAAFFGHTLVLMREGRIVQQGRYRELVDSPAEAFVEAFIQAQRAPAQVIDEPASP
jgi:osmoprotectant transport system ATP-binding protein